MSGDGTDSSSVEAVKLFSCGHSAATDRAPSGVHGDGQREAQEQWGNGENITEINSHFNQLPIKYFGVDGRSLAGSGSHNFQNICTRRRQSRQPYAPTGFTSQNTFLVLCSVTG